MYLLKKIIFCLWSDKELHFVDTKCKFVIWDVEKGENWKNVEEKKKFILSRKLQLSVQWSTTTDNHSYLRWKYGNNKNVRNKLFCNVFFLNYSVFNATCLIKKLLEALRACSVAQNSWRAVGKQVFPLSVCSRRWGNTEQTKCGKETILMMAVINDTFDCVRHSNTTTMGNKWLRTAEV